jgi:hypothetical protein
MPDRTADNLDRVWNARVTGQHTDSTLIDPSLDEAVGRFHAAEDVDRVGPAFVEHLWEHLMIAQTATVSIARPAAGGKAPPARHGTYRPVVSVSGRSRNRLAAAVAVAALLLATIGGFATLRSTVWDNSSPSRGGPAIYAPATPSPDTESTDILLAQISVPAGAFIRPDLFDERYGFGLTWASIPSNESGDWVPVMLTESPGIELDSIVTGALTVTPAGAVQVIRAGGDGVAEDVAAGTEIVLEPGDTLIQPLQVQATWQTGETPVEMVSGYVVPEPFQIGNGALEWNLSDFEIAELSPVPSEATTLRFRQLELAPDEAVPVAEGEYVAGMLRPGEFGFIGANSDGSITLIGVEEPKTVFVFSIQPGEAAATPVP